MALSARFLTAYSLSQIHQKVDSASIRTTSFDGAFVERIIPQFF